MHWYTYDRATWAIIIGIAAIVLGFPLSLLANLLTPKIRNWWAERSVAALKKRIVKLDKALAKMQRLPLLSEDQTDLFAVVEIVTLAIVGMIWCCLGILHVLSESLANPSPYLVSLYIIGGSILLAVALVLLMILGREVRKRSPTHRMMVEENINKLSAKLQSLQKS
jgi:Tfp pilus assembly protein PilN